MGNDDTQQILRSLIGSVNLRLDQLDDHIGELKGDVKATRVAVERNTTDIKTLYTHQGQTEKTVAEIGNTQINCPARKTQEAGVLPGTTADRRANTIAIYAGFLALLGVIIALITILK